MIEKFKQHWFVALLLVCAAVAGATWKVTRELQVEPREYQIRQLKEEIQKLESVASMPKQARTDENLGSVVLDPTGILENSSVTTRDGRCSIHVVRVSGG